MIKGMPNPFRRLSSMQFGLDMPTDRAQIAATKAGYYDQGGQVTEGSLNSYQKPQMSTDGVHQANSMQRALDNAPKPAKGTD